MQDNPGQKSMAPFISRNICVRYILWIAFRFSATRPTVCAPTPVAAGAAAGLGRRPGVAPAALPASEAARRRPLRRLRLAEQCGGTAMTSVTHERIRPSRSSTANGARRRVSETGAARRQCAACIGRCKSALATFHAGSHCIDEADDMRTDDDNTFAKGRALATFFGGILTQHLLKSLDCSAD